MQGTLFPVGIRTVGRDAKINSLLGSLKQVNGFKRPREFNIE